VVDRVYAVERRLDRIPIADVAHDELDLQAEVVRATALRAMYLRCEVIERPDAMALAQEFVGDMRADEPGSTGDEDVTMRHNPFG
jgi:hypothetical protein